MGFLQKLFLSVAAYFLPYLLLAALGFLTGSMDIGTPEILLAWVVTLVLWVVIWWPRPKAPKQQD